MRENAPKLVDLSEPRDLSAEERVLPYTAEDSYIGRDDYIGLTADGVSAAGTNVEVTLHVISAG